MKASLLVVDSRIADSELLLQGVDPSAQVMMLSPEDDGVGAITGMVAMLAASSGELSRLEILSHGEPGRLLLGRDVLDLPRLRSLQRTLYTWGACLGEAGEIVLHGCRVGATSVGQAFVEQFHRLTGVAIAANRHVTGGDRTEGNWDLDVLVGGASGQSSLSRRSRQAYAHTLATFTVTQATDDGSGNVPGTLSNAILQANATPGEDTILLSTDVTLSGVATRLINSDITLTGDDPNTNVIETRTISGGGAFRPLFVRSGEVFIQDLTITDGLAEGGLGGNGGAGAGLGGGLFVYGGEVAVQRVDFTNNEAVGGSIFSIGPGGGYGPITGGGGLYGDGYLGGGGLFGPSFDPDGGYGGSGNYGGFAGGGNGGGNGYNGGFGGGGGAGSNESSAVSGGNGGFGGGGGFGLSSGGAESAGYGGYGGFGGGGGFGYASYGYGGIGGYGAGGGGGYDGIPGTGGFGGGDGAFGTSVFIEGLGGTGAGFGGAVFVRSGTVTFETVDFSGNSATPGIVTGFDPGPGNSDGRGGAIFVLNRTQSEYASEFGNAAGVPGALPTVEAVDVTFSGNSASSAGGSTGVDGVGADQDNGDVYGTIAPGTPLAEADIAVFSNGVEFDGLDTPLALDDVVFGTTFEQVLEVSNVGTEVLNLTDVEVPEGFELSLLVGASVEVFEGDSILELEIAPESSLEFTLRRTEVQVNSFEGDIRFFSDDPDETIFIIPLTGSVAFSPQTPLDVDFELARLNLPATEVDESSVQLAADQVLLPTPQLGDVGETIVGTEEADVLFGLGGNDNLVGLGGNDFLNGNQGNASLRGAMGMIA